jgi:hypothetical protein
MTALEVDATRLPLLLHDLRLPAIARLWPDFAERADKEGWPAARRGSEAAVFWVTRTRGNSRPARAGFGYESYLVPKAGNLFRSGLLGLKRSQAQQCQPMRMPLAGHHFARAFALALRTSTAQEAPMVQKELK